jgi:hypothetical protein
MIGQGGSQRPEVPVSIAWVSMQHYAGVVANNSSPSQVRMMLRSHPSYRTLLQTVDSPFRFVQVEL